MAALDDLKTVVARLSASTSAELKAISDKLAALAAASNGSVAAADVETQVTALNAVADNLDAETKTLTT